MITLAQIREALRAGSESGGRAALFAEGKDPAVWQAIRQESRYARMRKELGDAAEAYRAQPIGDLTYSLYKINDLTGSRKEYEKAYYAHRGRLNTFAGMALLYQKPEDIEALEDAVWAICNEYTWCLPAHLNGKSLLVPELSHAPDAAGGVTTADRDQRRMIDLFAAETGFALAEILYLLGDKMAPLVVFRAKEEVVKRILQPFAAIDTPFVWETITNNWAAVCAGSVGAAAMYLVADDGALMAPLYRLLGVMDLFLEGYTQDGACTEGVGYWEYGFGFYVYFAELLKRRTAGKIDLLQQEKVKRMALFAQKCYVAENSVASFSDTGTVFWHHPGLFRFLHARFHEVEVPDSRYECGLFSDHCFRWCHFIRDLVWYGKAEPTPRENTCYFLPDAQWMVARRAGPCTSFGFAAKGGHNAESHNHNDLGSFVCNVNGDMLLTDLGSGEYTRDYFGPKRYELLCNGSQGHSVPIIEDTYQREGREHAARVIEASEAEATLTFDLTAAYADPNLRQFTRRFAFGSGGREELTVTDRFDFEKVPSRVTERLVSPFAPVQTADGELKISGPNGSVSVYYDASQMVCRLGTETFINHSAAEETVHIMDFEWKKREKNLTATLRVAAG